MSSQLPALLFLQLAVLLCACQLVAYVLRRLEQPPVIGQMVAGLVLGPSVMGLALPGWQQYLFPTGSLSVLRALGQVGLVLYMFVVGLELNHGLLRRHIKGATAVSVVGVVAPLAVGLVAALPMAADHRLFPVGVSPLTASLFFAAAISVTAFPVMARIIDERNLVGTTVATIALAAGSISDAVAWCLLAAVVATLYRTPAGFAFTTAGALAFTAAVVIVVRPVLGRLFSASRPGAGGHAWQLSTVLIVVMLAAWATEAVGVHPAFGAFLVGAVMPRNDVMTAVKSRITPLAANFLLPLFFVYAGLNTRIGLVNSQYLVMLTVGIVLIACAGKGLSTWLAARTAGYRGRDAAAVGVLMNARGLIELIILTTGLERGVITPTLFSMMVVMAVVTTVLASPLLKLIYGAPTRVVDSAAAVEPRPVEPTARQAGAPAAIGIGSAGT